MFFHFLLALSSSLNFPTSQPCPLSREIARHAVLGLLFLVWEVGSQGKGPLGSQAFLPKENRSTTAETSDSQAGEAEVGQGTGSGEGQRGIVAFSFASQNIFLNVLEALPFESYATSGKQPIPSQVLRYHSQGKGRKLILKEGRQRAKTPMNYKCASDLKLDFGKH